MQKTSPKPKVRAANLAAALKRNMARRKQARAAKPAGNLEPQMATPRPTEGNK